MTFNRSKANVLFTLCTRTWTPCNTSCTFRWIWKFVKTTHDRWRIWLLYYIPRTITCTDVKYVGLHHVPVVLVFAFSTPFYYFQIVSIFYDLKLLMRILTPIYHQTIKKMSMLTYRSEKWSGNIKNWNILLTTKGWGSEGQLAKKSR